MAYKKYIVKLKDDELKRLEDITARGSGLVRRMKHALILIDVDQAHGRGLTDEVVAKALKVGISTVDRVRKNYVEHGFNYALNGMKVNKNYHRKVTGELEAKLTMLACSAPPEGRARWTLTLLSDRAVALKFIDSISISTVGRILKKRN